MKEAYYKEQLSSIYKKHFKHFKETDNVILNEFVRLAQKANDDQNKRNASLNYQKTEKGKQSQHRRYIDRINKKEKNVIKKENIQKGKKECLRCGDIIKNKINTYTIKGKRPYCEKCFDIWSNDNPIGD